MRLRAPFPPARALLAIALACACAWGGTPGDAAGAGSAVVVTLDVASATSMSVTGCATGAPGVTNFGIVQPGTSAITSTDCQVGFGSTNDTAGLDVSQLDAGGSALYASGSGVLDGSFGTGGIRIDALGPNDDLLKAGVLDSSGRTVAVGDDYVGTGTEFLAARYLADGTSDPSFGTSGHTVIPKVGTDEQGTSVAIDDQNRIVIAGTITSGDYDVAIRRLLPDGSLDTSFGTAGLVGDPVGAVNEKAECVATAPGGRILVAGWTDVGATTKALVAAYLPSGARDTSFGTGGVTITAIDPTTTYAKGCGLQPDGKFVVTGQAGSGASTDTFVARYTTAGVLDTTFDTDGWNRVSVGTAADEAVSLAIDPSGAVVVAGSANSGSGDRMAISRFTSAGAPDTTFSGDGLQTVVAGTGNSYARSVRVQPDGAIVAAGDAVATNQDVVVVRLTDVGVLDPAFGTAGVRLVAVRANGDVGRDVVLGRDGALTIVGQSWAPATGNDASVVQLSGVTVPDWSSGAADWTSGTGFFGVCLRQVTVATADWAKRGDDTCPASNGTWWRSVPASASRVAHTTVVGTSALANLRFGVRVPVAQRTGRYTSPVVVTVVAPG